MWHYVLYWTIIFGSIAPSKQQGSISKNYDTRQQVDSAITALKAESQKHNFRLAYRIDSTKIK